MKKQKLFEIPIDNPLTLSDRELIEKQIQNNAHLSPKPVTYYWEENGEPILHIKAEPVLIEAKFQDKIVEIEISLPAWARLLFTEKRKADLKETILNILRASRSAEHPGEIAATEAFQTAISGADVALSEIPVSPSFTEDRQPSLILPPLAMPSTPAGFAVPDRDRTELPSPEPAAGLNSLDPPPAASPQPAPVLPPNAQPSPQANLRIVPGNDSVSIWNPVLFDDPACPDLREFVSRVFLVKDVTSVEIHPAQSFGLVRYKPASKTQDVLRQLGRLLKQSIAFGSVSSDAPELNQEGLALDARNLYLDESISPIRISRVGGVLSTWRLRYQDRSNVRLAHPILLKRKDVLFRLEEELGTIIGVEAFTANQFGSSISIRINPQIITVENLVRQLENSWPRLLEGLDGPPSSTRFFAASGLLGLAFAGQYLFPPIRPIAVAGVAIYSAPNVVKGAKELTRWQIGLPALYSTGLMFTLWGGMPFASALFAVLMQFWPRLTHQTMTTSQRRLFAFHRRRAASARAVKDDGSEVEIPIGSLTAGSIIAVRKGEVIPVDGIVTKGLAAVGEHQLSGQTCAADKTPGDFVYAGTIVLDGNLSVRAEKIGIDTVSGSIGARLPHSAIGNLPSSADAERIANRNAKPALALAGLSLLLTRVPRPSQAIIRPDYATGPRLSAQLAALHDIADGLRRGIFFQDPASLDRLAGKDAYVFDETFDLDRKQIEVADVIPAAAVSKASILGYAAAAFLGADSDQARALLRGNISRRGQIPKVFERRRVAGGVRYRDRDGRFIEIATPAYMAARGLNASPPIAEALAGAGSKRSLQTGTPRDEDISHDNALLRPLWVLRDGSPLGVITFDRSGEEEGKRIVEALKAKNKKAQLVYLSSGNRAEADALGEKFGFSAAISNLDADGKARALRNLGRTVWIGNGALPAALPSIRASTVSVSVAGLTTAASDIADIILLQPGVQGIASLGDLAAAHSSRIKADYRVIYAANLVGVAAGLMAGFGSPQLFGIFGRVLAGFGSLEVGLISNVGTGYVYARNWKRLNDLAAEV